ncbi:MAG: ribbon-helix-helix domain-containing protein [Vulcanimicrobiaceae bacterium]
MSALRPSRSDPIQYESRTRSLRIHGVLTTLRLENLFWDVLAEMAAREGSSTNQLIVKLHDELTEYRGETGNFTSFLRVCRLRHLSLAAGRNREREGPAKVALRAVG